MYANCKSFVKMKNMKPEKRRFMTTREAASVLDVSVRTVQLWVESGRLRAWKTVGGHRRLDPDSVYRLATRGEETEQRPYRVLIAEDERTQRKLLVRYLEMMPTPLEVHEAEDGYRGLLLIGQLQPELLITDLIMPGMDGFRMLQAITEAGMSNPPEVIVLTAMDGTSLKERGKEIENNTILHKPVEFAVLQQAVMEKLSAVASGRKP